MVLARKSTTPFAERQWGNRPRAVAFTAKVQRRRGLPMRIQIALLAAAALGAAACTEAEQDNAQADANEAGSALQEEAAQVGSAIKAGAKEVAQEIDEGTDRLAQEAEEQEAETAADARSNDGR